jgi:hypothetical protein
MQNSIPRRSKEKGGKRRGCSLKSDHRFFTLIKGGGLFMKKNIITTFIVLGFVLLVAGAGNVSAYKFCILGGEFELSGHLETIAGWRLQDSDIDWPDRPGERTRDAGDLGNLRNTLQLEFEYTLGDHVSIFGIYRFAYEASFDIQSVDQRARSTDYLDEQLRELYLMLDFDEWTIKIGKQQLVWGETDALRMADVINPLDVSWRWTGPEAWEDLRRGVRMAVITYAPERFIHNAVSLEAVFIPEDFQAAYLPHAGSNWEPTFDLPWDLFRNAVRASEPNDNNDEYGFRIRGMFKGVELSIFDFYGRKDGATVDLDKFLGFLVFGTHGIDFCDYPKFNTTGITANWYEPIVTKTVFRFEGSYTFDEPMNDLAFVLRKRDTINFMVGFDRPTWIRSLNPITTFFLSFQYFHRTILDWSDTEGLVDAFQSNDRHQDIITFLIQGQYANSVYTPELLFAYDFSGTWWLKPQFKWTYSGNWAFTLGANLFYAPTNRDSIWGGVRDNDEIFLRIRYSFQ